MPAPASSRRPPPAVAVVARAHALVGAAAFVSLLVLHLLTRNLPNIEFRPFTYILAASIGGTYCLTGLLVWFGTPVGRLLSRVCGLLYLARPQFGSHLWNAMSSPEYRAYFEGAPSPPEENETK